MRNSTQASCPGQMSAATISLGLSVRRARALSPLDAMERMRPPLHDGVRASQRISASSQTLA